MLPQRNGGSWAVWRLGWDSGLSQSLLFLESLWLVILEANRVSEHVAT